MSPSNLRAVAYWGLMTVILFTGLGVVAAIPDGEETPAPVAAPGSSR